MIVVDASVIVTALADDGPDGDKARRRLQGERLTAPHVIDLEVISAWRRMAAAGDIDERRADFAIADLQALRLDRVRHEPLLRRCWELRANLTVYDAAYVALAERLGNNPSHGRRQASKAPGTRCAIEVLT